MPTPPITPDEIVDCDRINTARLEAWLEWAQQIICEQNELSCEVVRDCVCEMANEPLDCNFLTP